MDGSKQTSINPFMMYLYRKFSLLIIVFAVALLGAGCYNSTTGDTEVHGIAKFKLPVLPKTGSHKVMVFSEMHYQPRFDSQDPPRILPPPDSVPISGAQNRYESLEEYVLLEAPAEVVTGYDKDTAAELYRVNCQVCHGSSMQGDGPIGSFITRGARPADLTADATRDASDGELFAFISEGGRQGYALVEAGQVSTSPMPAFKMLLTESDRWTLVKYLRRQ